MELHLGKMTLKELSEWFGLKPETLGKSSNTARAKKFEILKAYADYHLEEGKVFIDKIHIILNNINKFCKYRQVNNTFNPFTSPI